MLKHINKYSLGFVLMPIKTDGVPSSSSDNIPSVFYYLVKYFLNSTVDSEDLLVIHLKSTPCILSLSYFFTKRLHLTNICTLNCNITFFPVSTMQQQKDVIAFYHGIETSSIIQGYRI